MIKRRTVQSSIAWLLIIYFFPLVGITIYLLFGESKIDKYRANRGKNLWFSSTNLINNLKKYYCIFSNKNSEVAHSLFQLCENRQGIKGLIGNQVKLLTDSDEIMKVIIQDINLAKKSIEMIFYIWESGGLVDQIMKVLILAAQRGVNCRLILDSAGSSNFFRSKYPTILRMAGIHIVEALNINIFKVFFRRMDLRQHKKIVLIDNDIAYTGSMNMVDPRFFKKEAGIGQWIDIMIRMKGPVVIIMGIIFSCDWEIETGEHIFPPLPNYKIAPFKNKSNYITQVIASGPGFPEEVIHQALLISIYSAKKSLIITTPYLVPSDDLLKAICIGAKRGVKVDIIIPKQNDSILVNWASRAFFSELLESGVLIHQFKGGLLHTKSVVVDNQLSLIGTVNFDMRSLWINFEVTLAIDNKNFAKELVNLQESYIASSNIIQAEIWSKRPLWQKFIERFFYLFSPLL